MYAEFSLREQMEKNELGSRIVLYYVNCEQRYMKNT